MIVVYLHAYIICVCGKFELCIYLMNTARYVMLTFSIQYGGEYGGGVFGCCFYFWIGYIWRCVSGNNLIGLFASGHCIY